MKVLHLCLANFYIDEGSYQENLLPRFHKLLGYEVEIIASPDTFDEDGCLVISVAPKNYVNEDGINVNRLRYKVDAIDKKLKRFQGTYKQILKANPDIIFIHGCQFLDIYEVIRFLKTNTNVKVFVDNHADFSNSARNFLSKNILHRFLWRRCAQAILPYVLKFYGVLPSRVDFLINEYKVPEEKVELLVMGADDALVERGGGQGSLIRKKFHIGSNDFLIVTGGKIDTAKREVLDLMRVVNKLNRPKVKLLIFGSLMHQLKEEFHSLLSSNVIYAGWIHSEESYAYFDAADLVVFPGRHSVFWEQVVAQKKPLMVKKWDGTTHVDIGGNVIFLARSNEDEIYSKLLELLEQSEFFGRLKNAANSSLSEEFLYSRIAKNSLRISD